MTSPISTAKHKITPKMFDWPSETVLPRRAYTKGALMMEQSYWSVCMCLSPIWLEGFVIVSDFFAVYTRARVTFVYFILWKSCSFDGEGSWGCSKPKDLLWFLCLMMMTTLLVRAVVKALALEIKVMALELVWRQLSLFALELGDDVIAQGHGATVYGTREKWCFEVWLIFQV